MVVGVPKETFPGEKRVAMVPASAGALKEKGLEVVIESGAGLSAGYPDEQYEQKGARLVKVRAEVFAEADVIAQVRTTGANPDAGGADLELYRQGQTVIGFTDPLSAPAGAERLAGKGVTLLAMELVPRITRAQSMDALSSMASIAGYKAALLAAVELPRLFPMMMTAAGTIAASKVFVLGAGVAGLQAIATAKRLGASVRAYDLRPVVKEQVQSLGATFVELPLEAGETETAGGYAREMDEAFYRRQREMMLRVVAECDVVITTAAVPGKKAPVLVTGEMVGGMRPGSVIVDLAAEQGGNCELTAAGQTVEHNGVRVLGPTNVASSVPFHASQMYARNVSALLQHLLKDGELKLDLEDEITRESLVAHGGQVVHPGVREAMGSG